MISLYCHLIVSLVFVIIIIVIVIITTIIIFIITIFIIVVFVLVPNEDVITINILFLFLLPILFFLSFYSCFLLLLLLLLSHHHHIYVYLVFSLIAFYTNNCFVLTHSTEQVFPLFFFFILSIFCLFCP